MYIETGTYCLGISSISGSHEDHRTAPVGKGWKLQINIQHKACCFYSDLGSIHFGLTSHQTTQFFTSGASLNCTCPDLSG